MALGEREERAVSTFYQQAGHIQFMERKKLKTIATEIGNILSVPQWAGIGVIVSAFLSVIPIMCSEQKPASTLPIPLEKNHGRHGNIEQMMRGVGLIVTVTNGNESTVGTAFAVQPHLAVSSGYIAKELMMAAKEDVEAKIIWNKGGGLRSRINRIRLHPQFKGIESPDYNSNNRIQEGDVGVFELAEEAPQTLPIASQIDLEKTAPGNELSIIGYLLENNHLKPNELGLYSAPLRKGLVSNISDVQGGADKPNRMLMITCCLPGDGGLGGAPVLNDQGYVIGIHIAADFIIEKGPNGKPIRRIPNPAGFSYALRADQIFVLLDPPKSQ